MGMPSGLDKLTYCETVWIRGTPKADSWGRQHVVGRKEESCQMILRKKAMRIEGKSEEHESRNKGKRCFQKERMSGQQRQMVPPSQVGHRWKMPINVRLEKSWNQSPWCLCLQAKNQRGVESSPRRRRLTHQEMVRTYPWCSDQLEEITWPLLTQQRRDGADQVSKPTLLSTPPPATGLQNSKGVHWTHKSNQKWPSLIVQM